MTEPSASRQLLAKRLEMADQFLAFLSSGEQWPDMLELLVELKDIDPNFDEIVEKLATTAVLSEQIRGADDIDLVRDLGILIVGIDHAGLVVEAPDAGREFLGARFASDNRGIGWLITNRKDKDVKTPAYVVSQKAAQHLPVLAELKTGIKNKRLKDLLIIHDFRTVGKIKDTLQDLYKLTDKEAQVCQHMMAGENAAELALSMNVSRETVKSHLKQIFQKTNLRSQVELVRVLTQLTSVAAILKFKSKSTKDKNLILKQDYILLQSEVCKTRYGTDLYYSVCGDPKGRAVVLLHSPFGSRLTWPKMALAAKKHRVRLYCFDRPGYGNSDPVPTYDAKSIAGCMDDLLKANGHESADIIGFGYGVNIGLNIYPFMDCQIENIYLYIYMKSFYMPNSSDEELGTKKVGKNLFQQFNALLRSHPKVHGALWKTLRRVRSEPIMARIVKQAYGNTHADAKSLKDSEFVDFLVESFFLSGRQGAHSQLLDYTNAKKPFDYNFSDYDNVNITGIIGLEDENHSYKQAQNVLDKFPHTRFIPMQNQAYLFVLADLDAFLDIVLAEGWKSKVL